MSESEPILIGVGQVTRHPDDDGEPLASVIDLIKIAADRAAVDAGQPGLLQHLDAVHVVHAFSNPHRNPPAALAAALGATPAVLEYSAIGGNTPQWLANRVADRLAAGQSRLALLAGGELLGGHSLTPADIARFTRPQELDMAPVGDRRFGSHPVEIAHGAALPVVAYAVIETALRAREQLSLTQHRQALGQFGAAYSAVAATHPYAWFPIRRLADEVVTPSAENRMIAYPYPKYLTAAINVNQAAALLMTTTATARTLGIPESRWVYLHGGQDAHDEWFLSQRPDLADSPALRACVGDALEQAGIALDQIDWVDFYSCFPCMPRLARRALGLADADPRAFTLTGGLPYFGGPGNNYSMHAIATAVEHCRQQRDALALITANGWYCTKHAVGVYGGRPPQKPWVRTAPEDFQQRLVLPPPLAVDPRPTGTFIVEGYTVGFDREGNPRTGILCGRVANGQRAWAQTRPGDRSVLDAMMSQEWVGQSGRIVVQHGEVNLIEF